MKDYRTRWQIERDSRTCRKCEPAHTFDTRGQLRYHKRVGHKKVQFFYCGDGHKHYSEGAVTACEHATR